MLYSIVRRNSYQDSLRLMQLSSALKRADGVNEVAVMMGTPANKDVLRAAGMGTAELEGAKPADLVVVIDAADAAVGESLVERVDELLAHQAVASRRSGLRSARSLERAVGIVGEPNLALVSIPGEYVASEVQRLLDRNIHVFIFSDNVSVEDEVALKRRARERGLLVMGPDCGTGSLGGLPLAFANEVHAGSIGLVGASGSGLQEVMVQIDRHGGGVSHAIGVGGRDLGADVAGLGCLQAMRALDDDATTTTVVLISKPPAASVRAEVIGVARTLSKPVVAYLLGERPEAASDGNVHYARTLEETARMAVELAGPRAARPVTLRREQRWVKALYTGGSLAWEAAMLLGAALGVSGDAEHRAGYVMKSDGHEVIDLGDDLYTRGRPHPMIDPSLRAERIAGVFADPENAVLLLDVVLGHGCAPDPAGALAPVIADGLARLRADGRDLAVVASVCGTENDPQSLGAQTRALEQAGVAVLPDNAAAVRHALAILRRQRAPKAATVATPAPIRELLASPPRIVNIGLRGFAEILHARGADVVHYDWAPVAGGDARLQALLESLK
jgi:FdrA protein